ncbi:hypothetical protein [Aestuariivirga sp.]|uniref:AbiU2 domain-containing protein n=1 Tax=Aestuariivirga sp. TaxID=2650926 RepID=UPI00359489DC
MQNEPAIFYQDIMGPELGLAYWELAGELFTLSNIYADCAYLFGEKSEDRVKLLNKTAPRFFRKVQLTFENELLLGLCRLTDPAQDRKKNNLSVKKLTELYNRGKPQADAHIESIAEKATRSADFARDWRNRWLAHKDYDLSLNNLSVSALEPATLGKIDAALAAVDDTLKAVMSAHKFSSAGFRNISDYGAAPSLASLLHEGLLARDLRNKRAESGNSTDEDLALLSYQP